LWVQVLVPDKGQAAAYQEAFQRHQQLGAQMFGR
jgi:hypothetical protein